MYTIICVTIMGELHFGPARDKVKATQKPQIFKIAYYV